MKIYNKEQLRDIAYGATFLGAGGGGPLEAALEMIDTFEVDEFKVKDVTEVGEDEQTTVVAAMGAPQKLAGGPVLGRDSLVKAFDKMEKLQGKLIQNVIPVEVGGYNTIAPFAVAAQRGRCVVDGDGAGRAVPTLTLLTYASVAETNPAVLAKVGELGPNDCDAVALWVNTPSAVETMARSILTSGFDQYATLCMWTMDREVLERAVPVRGTLDLCCRVGGHLRRGGAGAVEEALQVLQAAELEPKELCRGRLHAITQESAGGFDRVRVVVDVQHPPEVPGVSIDVKNENIIVWNLSGGVLATVPDSICYVTEDGYPFTNSDFNHPRVRGKTFSLIHVKAREPQTQKPLILVWQDLLNLFGWQGTYRSIAALRTK